MSAFPIAESLRLLSLDGGGIKGLTTLLILKRIFRTLREVGRLDKEPKPCEVFDLIAGTSTGGLIAIMLGRLQMSIDECISVYENVGKRVFGKKPSGGQAGRLIKGLINSPFYDIRILQECMKDVLKEKELPVDVIFRETGSPRCKVMVCVTRKATSRADVLRTWETTHPTEENYDCELWEAASATAAAPIYFKSVKFIRQGEKWCDGGLRRNNPIREIIAEIGREKSLKARNIGCILSLGTGIPRISSVSANLAVFLRGAVNMMTNSEEVAEEFLTEGIGKELGDSGRYFRFNVPQGMQDLELDECDEIEKMRGLTVDYLKKVGSGNEVERCAQALLMPDVNMKNMASRKISLLPYNPCIHFNLRSVYSKALQKFFEVGNGGQHTFILWGLGGSGKTQIALSFAHTMNEKLSVFWVRAETYSSFSNDYCQILKLIKSDVDLPTDQIALADKTRTALESSFQNWLLVLDNADNFDDFTTDLGNEQSIRRFVPRNGRVLITTRDPRFLGGFAPATNGLQVKPMDPDEARQLLITSLPGHLTASLIGSDVQSLLDKLGNLPLGIAQAAANIDDLQLTFAEFVRAYDNKENRMEMMQLPFQDFQTFDPHTTLQSIFITWELSFERLQETAPLAAACLNYMGIFHWRRIPKRLIMFLPEFRSLHPYKFQGVVKRLLHLSLIDAAEVAEVGENWIEYDVHPLMHERISQRLNTTIAQRYSLPVIDVITSIFPVIPWHENGDEIERRRSLAQYLLPHALRLIGLMETLAIRSRVCARLLQLVGNFLTKVGRPFIGSIVSLKALEMAPSVFDLNDPSVHYIRKFAIASLTANAQYAEAKIQCQEALDTLESPQFQSHHDKASLLLERITILTEQIEALRGLNDYSEAEKALLALESLRSELSGLDPNDQKESDLAWGRAVQAHNVANNLRNLGRLDEARTLNRESLEIADSVKNNNPSAMTVSMNRAYLVMLNLKAHILCNPQPGMTQIIYKTNEQRDEVQCIYIYVLEKSLDAFGVRDIDTWEAANFCTRTMSGSKQYNAALDILLYMGEAAKAVEATFEGQKLETFARAVNCVRSIGSSLWALRSSNLRQKAAMTVRVYNYLVEHRCAESVARYETPVDLNNKAVSMISRGLFRDAEKVLKELLPKTSADTSAVEYYNMMLAIARQPGRKMEAYDFHKQNIEKITGAEAKYGDIDTRLRRDEDDLSTYNQAKAKIKEGQLIFCDAWWNEHEEALDRAELRYGVLFDDVPYEDSDTNKVVKDTISQILGKKHVAAIIQP